MLRKNLLRMSLTTRVLFCMSALLVVGCKPADKTPADVVVPVRVIKAVHTDNSSALHYVGTVEAESSAALSFKVQGNIRNIRVREGQSVTRGMLLAELDNETLQQSYHAAEATCKQAEDAMKRMQLLHDNQSLAEIKYVDAQTQLEKARSMYNIARQNLEDTRLMAPADGVIGQRRIENGENVLPGQPVFTLLNIRSVNIKIAVPEREIGLLQTQAEAAVCVQAVGDSLYYGRLSEKGVVADPATHTYEAKIKIDNPRHVLMPGMVCDVTVPRPGQSDESAIVLPNRCVQVSDSGERFVWCVADGKATKTVVETGALTREGVVIRSGLQPGATVIAEGMQKVSEGTKIRIL